VSAATGKDITGNNPLDTGVADSTTIQQAWVQHFVNTFGSSTSANGVRYYILDNEPRGGTPRIGTSIRVLRLTRRCATRSSLT
jgi:hypothetical protein